MAGSAIQGAFWHTRQAPLYSGAPAVGDPVVLVWLASRWPDAVHVRVEIRRALWQLKLYITCSDISQALQHKTSAVLQARTSASVFYMHLEQWACLTLHQGEYKLTLTPDQQADYAVKELCRGWIIAT